MKKTIICAISVFVITMLEVFSVYVSVTAKKEECVEKLSQVVQALHQQGLEKAIKKVNDMNGPFVWKDSYVYMMDLSGTMVATISARTGLSPIYL